MPEMDMSSMAGMAHGQMSTVSQAESVEANPPRAGMTPGSTGGMGGMVMSDGSMMAMKPMPKGIERRISGPAEAALQAFNDALEVGNRDLAIAHLAPDLHVVENGITEDRAAYIGSHLAADIDFQKTVRSILLARTVSGSPRGPQTVSSTMRLVSNRSDRTIDIVVGETATIVPTADGWRIARLEWHSNPSPGNAPAR